MWAFFNEIICDCVLTFLINLSDITLKCDLVFSVAGKMPYLSFPLTQRPEINGSSSVIVKMLLQVINVNYFLSPHLWPPFVTSPPLRISPRKHAYMQKSRICLKRQWHEIFWGRKCEEGGVKEVWWGRKQCSGSGYTRIRTFWSDPDPIKLYGSGTSSGSGSDHIKSYSKTYKKYIKCKKYIFAGLRIRSFAHCSFAHLLILLKSNEWLWAIRSKNFG